MTCVLLLLQVPLAGPLLAQESRASAGVAPDTVTVGDHFRTTLRVRAPEGATVEFPQFRLIEPVQAADSVCVSRDSAGAWTATYTLAAWVTSDSLVATFPFRIRTADGRSQDHRIRVVLPKVRSVLPADSALHQPRPAKAVLPIVTAPPPSRGWLLPALVALLLAVLIAWFLLRTRGAKFMTPVDPRTAALAALNQIDAERFPGRGLIEEHHTRVSRVLRHYLAAVAGWGEDRTSTELLAMIPRDGMDEEERGHLERILAVADRVKFSGGAEVPDRERAIAFARAVRAWIVAWPPEPVPPEQAEAA